MALVVGADEGLRAYATSWRERGVRAWAEGWWALAGQVGDVIGRVVFNSPVKGTPEIVSASIVIICFLQAAYAIRSGGMIWVDAVVSRLPPQKLMRFAIPLYVVGLLLLVAASALGSPWLGTVSALITSERGSRFIEPMKLRSRSTTIALVCRPTKALRTGGEPFEYRRERQPRHHGAGGGERKETQNERYHSVWVFCEGAAE